MSVGDLLQFGYEILHDWTDKRVILPYRISTSVYLDSMIDLGIYPLFISAKICPDE